MPENHPSAPSGSAASYEAFARAALASVTAPSSVGEYAGAVDEGDGATSILFESLLPGYPDWHWTVSIGHLEGEEPTVLEAELMPGEGSLLSPEWVPWADRLAEYSAAQAALAGGTDPDHDPDDAGGDASGAADSGDDDDDDDDDADSDDEDDDDDDDEDEDDDEDDADRDDDDDEDDDDLLHAGDLDGVDIDEEPDDEQPDGDDPDAEDDPDEESGLGDEREKTY